MRKEMQGLMRQIREGKLPSSEAIVKETFSELGFSPENLKPDGVQTNFNDFLKEAFVKTLEVLERYEDRAYASSLIDELVTIRKEDVKEAAGLIEKAASLEEGFQKALKFLFERWYPYLRWGFLSISQSRKTRGGKDFELQVAYLLELMEIPYEKKKRLHRVDFMIPSDEAFRQNPNRALILSAKRTLRERWREVVEELQTMRSPNVYLITADENISQGHVEGICERYRIHLVVWDDLKIKQFSEEPLVISYTTLANEIISDFKRFW